MPPKKQKIPALVDMLIDASGKYDLSDASGRQWTPTSIKNLYNMIQEEYGDPMEYLNTGNILKEVLSSGVRYLIGDDFQEEKDRYKKYGDFLERAYSGDTEKTPAVQDSLYNILMEYENNYDFLNPKGQKVAKDVIKRHLYSINELENLYTKKYLNK